MTEVKNMFSERDRSDVIPREYGDKSRKPAQQQFKDDTDINVIIKRMMRDSFDFSELTGEYGDAMNAIAPQTLLDAMLTVQAGEDMFAALPSAVRNEFNNSPSAFLEFVQDGNNAQRAAELGIGLAPGVVPVVPEPPAPVGPGANPSEPPAGGMEPPPGTDAPQT